MPKVKLNTGLGYTFLHRVETPIIVEADEWIVGDYLVGYKILSSSLHKAGAADEVFNFHYWPALKCEVELVSDKPQIKLIDRRKQYEQRKLNFIARMNQYVNLYLGLTISRISDAIEVSRMMKQCTPDDYYLGLSRIKVNQSRESK